MVTTPSNTPAPPSPVQGGTSVRQQPARQDTPQRPAGRPAVTAAARDPSDVEAATRRLDQLLARDVTGEPRKDVPRRGYYLNILV